MVISVQLHDYTSYSPLANNETQHAMDCVAFPPPTSLPPTPQLAVNG